MTARRARKALAFRAAAVIAAAGALAVVPSSHARAETASASDAAPFECAAKKKPGKARSQSKKSSKAKPAPAEGGEDGYARASKHSVVPRPRPMAGGNPAGLAAEPAGQAAPPAQPAQAPAQAPVPAPAGPFVPAQMDPQNPNRQPDYPMESRSLGEQGRVVLWVEILADGSVGRAMIATSSLSPRLDAAALAAARTWHYIPATRGGVPVTSGANVLVDFKLSN